MKINKEVLQWLSTLAEINISESEYADIESRLKKMSDAVDSTAPVKTEDIEPMCNPFDQIQRLRVDEVTEENHRDLYQQTTQYVEDGLYLVPQVIE